MKLADHPNFEPLDAEHVAPFYAHCESANGSRLIVRVSIFEPQARRFFGRITYSGIDYPDLMHGVERWFDPYGNFYVEKK